MRKLFLLTSILLLSVSWMLAQASSGSSATDQNTSSGSSVGSQSSTDQMNQGAQPGSTSGSSSQSGSSASSSDQNEPQSRGGYTQSQTSSGASQQGNRGESMSSQQGETSSDMSSSGTSKSSAGMGGTAGSQTIEGCLSETNGKFHLTDNMGTSYELTGKTANLKSHVGHTISVTGKASASGANKPGAMSGEQAGMEQTIRVTSFRHVSGSCKTGSPGAMPSGSSPSGGSSGGSHY